MQTNFQKGQQVKTPDGLGTILELLGDKVTVKLESGEEKSYPEEDLEDDADQG